MERHGCSGCACGAVPPGFHIFRSSRIAWFETADNLPRHALLRPKTRGLPEG